MAGNSSVKVYSTGTSAGRLSGHEISVSGIFSTVSTILFPDCFVRDETDITS